MHSSYDVNNSNRHLIMSGKFLYKLFILFLRCYAIFCNWWRGYLLTTLSGKIFSMFRRMTEILWKLENFSITVVFVFFFEVDHSRSLKVIRIINVSVAALCFNVLLFRKDGKMLSNIIRIVNIVLFPYIEIFFGHYCVSSCIFFFVFRKIYIFRRQKKYQRLVRIHCRKFRLYDYPLNSTKAHREIVIPSVVRVIRRIWLGWILIIGIYPQYA